MYVGKLRKENQALHNGLRITRLSGLNCGHAPLKTSFSLSGCCNRGNGKLDHQTWPSTFALHLAEYYGPELRLTQCFKWQAYVHVAPVCRKAEACMHCVGGCNTQDCTTQTQLNCAVCRKRRSLESRMQHSSNSQGQKYASLIDGADSLPEAPRCDRRRRGGTSLDIGRIKETEAFPAATDRRRAGPGHPPAVQTLSARSQRTLSFAKVFQPQARAFGSASQSASSDDHVDKPAGTDMDDERQYLTQYRRLA